MVVERRPHLMLEAPTAGDGERRCRREELLAWCREYRDKGKIWRGSPPRLPPLPDGALVLELGCGNGKTLAAMLGRTWRVAAVDVSPRALRLGRDLAVGISCQGPPVRSGASSRRDPPALRPEFIAADAVQLPFKASSFDAVFAFHVLGHLRDGDRREAAREAARVLKAGGRLFFLEFGVEDMRAGLGEEVEALTFRRGEGIITHYFSEGEVLVLFDLLMPTSIRTERWPAGIRGRDLLRSEVGAEFIKV